MALLAVIAAVLLGLLGGAVAGFRLGGWARGLPRRYWTLNGVAVGACMIADFIGILVGWPWLAYGAIGAMAGTLTGLKYGYSEALDVWKPLDPASAEQGEHEEIGSAHEDPVAE